MDMARWVPKTEVNQSERVWFHYWEDICPQRGQDSYHSYRVQKDKMVATKGKGRVGSCLRLPWSFITQKGSPIKCFPASNQKSGLQMQ